MTNETAGKLKALELADIEATDERITHYEDCDYLTINTGRNGRDYAWYADESHNIAVDIETLEVLTNQEIDKYLA